MEMKRSFKSDILYLFHYGEISNADNGHFLMAARCKPGFS